MTPMPTPREHARMKRLRRFRWQPAMICGQGEQAGTGRSVHAAAAKGKSSTSGGRQQGKQRKRQREKVRRSQ